jgi:hypothetical protein
VSHTSSQASMEFRLFVIVFAIMIAVAVFVMAHTADSLGKKVGCIASPGAEVCGTQVTRP